LEKAYGWVKGSWLEGVCSREQEPNDSDSDNDDDNNNNNNED
jgi:hypothetical protein